MIRRRRNNDVFNRSFIHFYSEHSAVQGSVQGKFELSRGDFELREIRQMPITLFTSSISYSLSIVSRVSIGK